MEGQKVLTKGYRLVAEDSSTLCARVFNPICGPLSLCCIGIQYGLEGVLYPIQLVHRIPHRLSIQVRKPFDWEEIAVSLTAALPHRPMDHEISTDTFPVWYILVPCGILSLIVNYRFSFLEILWSFSILLEAVVFLPQLHMLRITGQAEALTRYYIVTLAWYRAMYVPNWIYRYVYLCQSSLSD